MKSTDLHDLFRRHGFLQADLDRLGRLPPASLEELDQSAGDEADRLRSSYCGTVGAEFMHVPDATRRRWVADRMEEEPPRPDRARLLRRLAEAEIFERFLHQRYPGTKRYSLEGCCALIPLLDVVFETAAEGGARTVLLGMSHRGRLNVMANIVHVPQAHIFAGFEDGEPRDVLGGGDVRYHKGATGGYQPRCGGELGIHLVSNPSHLEAVDPILVGRARARQAREGARGRQRVLPVLLHGDAAFAGQGIVSEVLNLADLNGYSVGGTVHIVVNNLIGFTTPPSALHSSRFATDAAKRVPIPILHVNGEDPEAIERAGRIATMYRNEFGSDVVIDLIGYRRYGHSELDDPTITQPLLYARIEKRPLLYRDYGKRSGVDAASLKWIESKIRSGMEAAIEEGRRMETAPPLRTLPSYWDRFEGGYHEASREVATAVERNRLRQIGRRLSETPNRFSLHDKVEKGLERRREMADGNRPLDWGMAEALAFGSLLDEGIPVRLAGQDSRRGTFGHRHSVLFDTATGREHVPLEGLCGGGAFFETLDTTLSEAAALGFEYGFSRDYPEALVCWEAQFGDFVNGAQVIIDQFISAAEDKWDLLSGIVLLLPHGHEGQGPEHSSARPERFLQAAAEHNIQLCQPTTAAQYFHLLRRQALRNWRKPLVVLTPKGLLRLDSAASSLQELAEGRFKTVLPDPDGQRGPRLLICTGRLAHDLFRERRRRSIDDTPIVRLEQIYPVPEQELIRVFEEHREAREIVWVQEEPANMGALRFILPHLERLSMNRRVTSVRRSESGSPATGSYAAHRIEQTTLINIAFGGGH